MLISDGYHVKFQKLAMLPHGKFNSTLVPYKISLYNMQWGEFNMIPQVYIVFSYESHNIVKVSYVSSVWIRNENKIGRLITLLLCKVGSQTHPLTFCSLLFYFPNNSVPKANLATFLGQRE